jgi:hypothetical protein
MNGDEGKAAKSSDLERGEKRRGEERRMSLKMMGKGSTLFLMTLPILGSNLSPYPQGSAGICQYPWVNN